MAHAVCAPAKAKMRVSSIIAARENILIGFGLIFFNLFNVLFLWSYMLSEVGHAS
jgi:hypothetical protein